MFSTHFAQTEEAISLIMLTIFTCFAVVLSLTLERRGLPPFTLRRWYKYESVLVSLIAKILMTNMSIPVAVFAGIVVLLVVFLGIASGGGLPPSTA